MKTRQFTCLLAMCSSLAVMPAHAQQNLKLWYNKPAANWNEALPIGNGRLAAMVFGGPATEQLQLNEETIWAGGPHNNANADSKVSVPQLRELINQKKFVEAQALANKTMTSKQNGMPYQTVGSLFIRMEGQGEASDYYRDLDISRATSSVKYTANGVHYVREMFVSAKDQAVIVRLTADKPASINCELYMKTPLGKKQISTADGKLLLTATTGNNSGIEGQVKFQSQTQAVLQGGSQSVTDTSLIIKGANTATLYITVGSNFINYHDLSADGAAHASADMVKAIKTPYADALKAHVVWYQKYFDRVKFTLGGASSDKPTDQRVKEFTQGNDPGLVPLYYQFGRYLLISSSQPGNQPATLQGKWNNLTSPPWGSKYTININTEMNYWPAEITNLSELTEPLIKMVKELSVTGQQSASKIYGARGWMAHHNTDLWRITGVVDPAYYGVFPTGGAWLTEHLWEHYLFTGDKKYLKDVYPVLKGATQYFIDALQEEPDHKWLVVSPSMSPEHEFTSAKGVGGVTMTQGTTMDNQIIFELFSNTIAASKALGTDKIYADSLAQKLSRFAPMQIGKWGQLQEWMEDWDKKGDTHRHISQLFGLYPGKQMSPYRNPELQEASINILKSRGDVSTGWSMGWKVNFWARLLDGEHAYKLISDQLRPAATSGSGGTYPNLFDAHPPFQIDGNFGCTAGITEMLLQSYDGEVFIMPALPKAWGTGSIKGLVARGGFVIDMDWNNGAVTKLQITSKLGGNLRLRLHDALKPSGGFTMATAKGDNPNPFYHVDKIKAPIIADASQLKGLQFAPTKLYDIKTVTGKTYTLVGK
ncbi:glycoside hydrolase family 95 protein [Mucilaginibacter myungsuensis]|uniref:Glycoside hydrolase family 95 protein n=1 Tax=Mucilaginibacter myungsuensis TaxID=649104 RepID=A0A929PX32_9SPHI|nr:glycoside hydrolase family 95 protein [Mucilaginibacter myungsuensis]MBE9661970.1 glycoside hydrolase family 95 protein [Mucilaginibacter myungsuensis]MDN3599597.1 glycoside hydrolase family 95 protein [Mucilaginibacter myungsuensis]